MFWVWPRSLTLALGVLLGLWLGGLVGARLGLAEWGVWVGGGSVALLLCVIDGFRGGRVLAWLSSDLSQPSPSLTGLWGELGLRAERALRQRDQRIRTEQARLDDFLGAIEASPNGVVLLDAGEQILWCNRTAAEHLGLDPERDRMQRVTNLVRAPAFVTQLHGAPAEDHPVLIPTVNGKGLLSVLMRPYGEGQRLLLTQDVTERERAEATRRDFVANVSHEIRTPLTVLSGFVETLTELPLGESERQRVLLLMSQQTRRMQGLVGDLLTLARLEGNPRPSYDHWTSIDGLGCQLESDAHALSAGRHQLAFDWGSGWELAGAESEFQSAVANLVSNAIRYTPEGGRVAVKVDRSASGGLLIEVRDTGPGIAPQHLPRLTERFYRVDGSRSRDTGGTGLGLSIVKHVMLRHGGELRVSSEVGRGSVFTLAFPASRCRQVTVQVEEGNRPLASGRCD